MEREVAGLKPATAPVASRDVAAASALLWGLTPLLTGTREVRELEQLLLREDLVRRGAIVVFVNVSTDLGRSDANFLNVQRVG